MRIFRVPLGMSLMLLLSVGLLAAGPASEAPTTPPAPVAKAPRPTTSVPRTDCTSAECHGEVKQYSMVHGPVNVDACDACHTEADASQHTFAPARDGKELCSFCHQLAAEEEYLHEPVAEGQCSQCHNPHGGQDRFMLKGGAGAASCAECHEDVTQGMTHVHGPVAAGACTACHRPHSSAFPKLLIGTGRDLCLECHVTLKKRLDGLRTIHEPVEENCSGCHLPHAAEHKMLLKQTGTELCLDCHSQIKDLMTTSATQHDAVSTEEACRNCHTPHGSDFSALLINDMVDTCLSCHDKEIKVEGEATLMNMKTVLASGKSLHGPIAERNCVACHQIHGGANFRLLFKAYPPEFYAPFQEERYALCFACHERQLVHDEKTTSLTDFRNGDVNMHYLHVNKKTKGRTCRACHETHASDKAKHIRDLVPFGSGGWKLPTNFEKTDTGGRCSPGCHRPYGYDRVNPVQNLPSQEPPVWPAETTRPAPGEGKREGGQP